MKNLPLKHRLHFHQLHFSHDILSWISMKAKTRKAVNGEHILDNSPLTPPSIALL